jgi:hypothetical protein
MNRLFAAVVFVMVFGVFPGCEDVNGDPDAGDLGGFDILSPDTSDDVAIDVQGFDVVADVQQEVVEDLTCLNENDCEGGKSCFSPGQSNCGICMLPENLCELDAGCAELAGTVCDYSGNQSCVCNSQKTCVLPCNVDGGNLCDPDTQVCDGTGHCAPKTCSSDGSCSLYFVCPMADSVPACTRKTCVDSAACGDGGWCVKGFCYGEPGHCDYMAP